MISPSKPPDKKYKMSYIKLTEREIYPGLDVIYHPVIDSESGARKTKVLSDIKTIGKDKLVKVEGVSGGVFIEALEIA